MTISTTAKHVDYTGNGATVFAVPFVFFDASDLAISGTGSWGAYTVTGGNGSTGSVTFATAPTGDFTIERETPLLQPTAIVGQGVFRPEDLEAGLDRTVALLQQVDGRVEVEEQARALDVQQSVAAEAEARAADVKAIIDSGLEPLSVGLAPVIASGGTVVRTVAEHLADLTNPIDHGVVGDGVADDTAAWQAIINDAGTNGYRIVSPPGKTYRITSTLDFSGMGAYPAPRICDFGGSKFQWDGTGVASVFYVYNVRFLSLRNFALDGNGDTDVVGVKLDSLQPDGTDHIELDNFTIRNCGVGVSLGSVGAGQNRVSDSIIRNFLIEACITGILFLSTNTDNVAISSGITAACEKHIHLSRAGFVAIRDVTGYGANFNGGINSFIYITGPIGNLTIESCQEEDAAMTPFYFLRRDDYTVADLSPINLISCLADNDILFEAGSGSGSIVNFIGGYFSNLTVDADDLFVNLIGCRHKPGTTLTLAGTNSMLRRVGANVGGTVTVTGGFDQTLAATGYSTMPNGLIWQWGTVAAASLAATTGRADAITFPKAFPNGVLNVVASALSSGGADIRGWVKDNATASGVTVAVQNDAGIAQDVGCRWWAIGY